MSSTDTHPNQGFLHRAHRIFSYLGLAYGVAIVLLAIPFIQTNVLYLNRIRIPWGADYDSPESYGLAPGKTLNLHLNTSDNVTLGAWFVLSEPFYQTLPLSTVPSTLEAAIPTAVTTHPTILFLHGNAATRAFHMRVQHYAAFSSRLHTNVLAVDYRGFGDSTGHPTEHGVVTDARTAFDWLVSRGAKPENVLIVGHSLGTGIGSALAAQLNREGIKTRGVALLSPFSSIRSLLDTYAIGGLFPLMKPLAMIPFLTNAISWALRTKFDTLELITQIVDPVLIGHAFNDWDIPHTHSDVLFNKLAETVLPVLPIFEKTAQYWTPEQWKEHEAVQETRGEMRLKVVSERTIDRFGTVQSFPRPRAGKVTLVKSLQGGHDRLGNIEGLHDLMAEAFDLRKPL